MWRAVAFAPRLPPPSMRHFNPRPQTVLHVFGGRLGGNAGYPVTVDGPFTIAIFRFACMPMLGLRAGGLGFTLRTPAAGSAPLATIANGLICTLVCDGRTQSKDGGAFWMSADEVQDAPCPARGVSSILPPSFHSSSLSSQSTSTQSLAQTARPHANACLAQVLSLGLCIRQSLDALP